MSAGQSPTLIVHRDPARCEELQQLIESQGQQAIAVRSGSGALMLLGPENASHHNYPRLILNSRLTDMTGRTLIEKLKANGRLPREVIYLHEAEDPALLEVFSGVLIHNLPQPTGSPQKTDLSGDLKRLVKVQPAGQLSSDRLPRILLVDDNELGRQMVNALLENIGCRVIAAANGHEALQIVRTEEVDLILMDLQMPVMDGLTATREIRRLEQPWAARIPILAMTADVMADQKSACWDAGMNSHVAKPVELEHLYAELRHWLPGLSLEGGNDRRQSEPDSDLAALLPGLEVDAGVRRSGGEHRLYWQLLTKFRQHYGSFVKILERDLAAGELSTARRRVHNLKGVAGNLGARALYLAAADLEGQLSAGHQTTPLERLKQELEQILNQLQSLPDHGMSVSSIQQADPREFLLQLREPLRSLQAQQVTAITAQLRATVWPSAQQSELETLCALIERYQYAPAAEMVDQILADDGRI